MEHFGTLSVYSRQPCMNRWTRSEKIGSVYRQSQEPNWFPSHESLSRDIMKLSKWHSFRFKRHIPFYPLLKGHFWLAVCMHYFLSTPFDLQRLFIYMRLAAVALKPQSTRQKPFSPISFSYDMSSSLNAPFDRHTTHSIWLAMTHWNAAKATQRCQKHLQFRLRSHNAINFQVEKAHAARVRWVRQKN